MPLKHLKRHLINYFEKSMHVIVQRGPLYKKICCRIDSWLLDWNHFAFLWWALLNDCSNPMRVNDDSVLLQILTEFEEPTTFCHIFGLDQCWWKRSYDKALFMEQQCKFAILTTCCRSYNYSELKGKAAWRSLSCALHELTLTSYSSPFRTNNTMHQT